MAHSAPKGLAASGKKLWNGIAGPGKYTLRADELQVLEDACYEADLISVLRVGMVGEPLKVRGSQGQDVINPIIAELRQHRATLATLLRSLKLPDLEGEASSARSTSARAAANARWARRGA